ncbi:MAG TPA: YebC/PmpR family DNA-binding transcriptional regulator [Candidatus Azoamicus sp.]
MAGHSKWANIKHKKKINDQKKSKLFSKLANNIKSSLKEKNNSGENNKLKTAINNAINNNLNKEIINKIILNYDKNYKTDLISFKKNEYIIIIESIIDNKNKNISEIKTSFINNEFKYIENKNVFDLFDKICKINIINYYNEKNILKISNFDIINFEDNIIEIDYNNINLITLKLKNKSIKYKNSIMFYPKERKKLNNNEQEDIKLLIKKIKKKEFITNIFTNIEI